MVLRYKILFAVVVVIFAIFWLGRLEFFPFSSNDMYADSALGGTTIYYVVHDPSGNPVHDNSAFYFVPSASAGGDVQASCFRADNRPCIDYYTLVARWLQQPITIEQWRWDYGSNVRRHLGTVTITP